MGGRDYHEQRRRRSKRKFVQIWHEVVQSPAFQSLSVYGVAALVYLCDRYNGVNNGRIPFSVGEMATRLRTGTKQARRALAEITDRGLALPARTGWFSPDHCHSTEWRITFQATNKPATNEFRNWAPTVVPGNTVALTKKKFPVVSGETGSGPREHTSATAKMNDSGPREHTSDQATVVPATPHVHSSQIVDQHTAAADASNAVQDRAIDPRMEQIRARVVGMVADGATDEAIYTELEVLQANLAGAGRPLPADARQIVADAIASARRANQTPTVPNAHQRPLAGDGRAS
jgi:hypothetical protein